MLRSAAGLLLIFTSACTTGGVTPTDAGGRADTSRDRGFDSGPAIDAGPCRAVTREAEQVVRPVDVVVAIDSSGSMGTEAEAVRANLAGFVDRLGSLNVRLVVLADADGRTVLGEEPFDFGSIPTDLGPERYLYIDAPVSSFNSLTQLLVRLSEYESFLRPDSVVHVIVVTDDESEDDGPEFRAELESRLGRSIYFHAVASEAVVVRECIYQPELCERLQEDVRACASEEYPFTIRGCGEITGCSDFISCVNDCDEWADRCEDSASFDDFEYPCSGANGIGRTYLALSSATSGTHANVCDDAWAEPFFSAVAERAVEGAPLPCVYALPEPPAGQVLDRNRINVELGREDEEAEVIVRVEDANECGERTAWYLDEDDSTVRLCENACQTEPGTSIAILFGCQSRLD